MKYRDRIGNEYSIETSQDKFLKILYGNRYLRVLIKLITQPVISEIGGIVLDSYLSRFLIDPFIKNNNIDISKFKGAPYKSYNDFFKRKMKKKYLNIDYNRHHVISPCDSKLLVHDIDSDTSFYIKDARYNMKSLLKNERLAERYKGGKIMIFRLCVDDYHRYCYVADGKLSKERDIKGCYHTVNPYANMVYPIYKENHRKYSLLKTKEMGTVLCMEVGALMVGKISNNLKYGGYVKKGTEKGHFEFGGSTVILIFEKDKIKVDQDIQENSKHGIETLVKYGEKIGKTVI